MLDEVKKLLLEGIEKGDFPGASFCLVDRHGHMSEDYIGYKELIPTKVALSGNEIYDVASLSKVITTTTLIMKLVEQNTITLDTLIKDVLPWVMHHDITVRHLLTHTSGLPADIPKASTLTSKNDVIEQIKQMDKISNIGERVIYSDVGFILLGLMIETLCNKPLDEVAKAWIFDPLQMSDTSYRPDRQRVAPTELREDDVHHGMLRGDVHDEKSYAMGGLSGHAGLFSTSKDIGKFMMALLQERFVLKQDTVDLLFEEQALSCPTTAKQSIRTIGWEQATPKGVAGDGVAFSNTIMHTGFTGCHMFIDRYHGLGFVLLSNAVHPRRDHNNIMLYRNKIGNIIVPNQGR